MLAFARLPGLRGYCAHLVQSVKGALQAKCRKNKRVTCFPFLWFLLSVRNIVFDFLDWCSGIVGLGGQSTLGLRSLRWDCSVLVLGSRMGRDT